MVFATVLTAPAISVSLFERMTGWYIDNQIFMVFVSVTIFIDHLAGSYVHYFIKKDFSWRKNRNGLFTKLGGSILGYVLFEMFHQIVKDVDFIAIYLKVLLQLVVFWYPFFSAIINLSIATNGKMPPKGLFKKFVKFEDTADLSIFKTALDGTEQSNKNDDTDINNDTSDSMQE